MKETIKKTLEDLENLLVKKGAEYIRNNDVFHNFNEGAKITGQTPEKVLYGFLLKHLISVNDIRNDLDKGIIPTEFAVNEKYNDILIYFLLEKSMLIERIKKEKNGRT